MGANTLTTTPANVAPGSDRVFSGSIPELYERFMVPLKFEPYAADIAKRVATFKPGHVLEIAAGTGVVTRHLARELQSDCEIVATDLNQAMLDHAAGLPIARAVQWRQADAMSLPFADGSFDLVVCQFGVMFFPDKLKAFSEARRVLKAGGAFLFNVWDRIECNDISLIVTEAMTREFPDDPPLFMQRTPHGYHDKALIATDLHQAGFTKPAQIETLAMPSLARSAKDQAIAICQGTPLRNELEARAPGKLAALTDIAAAAVAQRLGGGDVAGRLQAHVVVQQA